MASLETLVVPAGGGDVLMESRGRSPGMLVNPPQCTGQPPQDKDGSSSSVSGAKAEEPWGQKNPR